MKRLAAAALLAATPALADVGIEMQIDGYSDLFKECEFGFAHTDFGAGYSKIDFAYEVHVRGAKISQCEASFEGDWVDTQCQGVPGVEDDHTCEDLTKVRALGVRCFDGAGARTDCGTLRIRGADVFTFD